MVRGSTHEGAEWTGEQQGTKAQALLSAALLACRQVFSVGRPPLSGHRVFHHHHLVVPQTSVALCILYRPNEGGTTGNTRSSLNEAGVFN
jgi:hypothetical protein